MDISEILNKEIECCKDMMRSIYAYGELTSDDKYLTSYRLKLGNLIFNQLFKEHSEFLKEHFKAAHVNHGEGGRNVDEVLRTLEVFQNEVEGKMVPCGWKPGDEFVK